MKIIAESMEKINGLYNDLNELANDQDDHLKILGDNMDDAVNYAKEGNKQLRKAKPNQMCNVRLIVAMLVLSLVVSFFISHYLISPWFANDIK